MNNYNHNNDQHNDYQKSNGAKAAGAVGKKIGQKGKKALGKIGKKLALKLGKAALKKLASGILLKTAPIWGGILLLVLLIASMLSVFLPDVTAEKTYSYETVAMEIGISAKELLAFDTVLYDNEDMEERNPSESAYHFFRLTYEKFEPEYWACKPYTKEDGTPGTECGMEPEKIIERKDYQGKSDLMKFFESKKVSTEDIPEALSALRDQENTRVFIIGLLPEVAMDQAGFTEEQKEYYYEILEIGFISEEFPNLDSGLYSGATCSVDQTINEVMWDSSFAKAGVFKNHGDTFIEIANKKGIDPVLMAAIAFHETGFGTSNAVKTKNNPGGLMNPNGSGLFVYKTLKDGLESMGKTLHNRIIKDGKNTIEKLGSVYAPVGASNDPNGLNSHWVPTVTKIVQSLGGLTMNCENYGASIPIDGNVSEIANIAATSGYKWIGNSVYVFGGGRSNNDIARGRFDCSSFVRWAYLQAGIELSPLTSVSTETLNKIGTRISYSEIQVGDLIFWDTYKKDGHVGIYVGGGKWIGAQSSSGVAIVNFNNSYWMSKFSGHVRRVL